MDADAHAPRPDGGDAEPDGHEPASRGTHPVGEVLDDGSKAAAAPDVSAALAARPRGARGHRHEMQATYRYLRLAIVLLTLLLAISVALQIIADDGEVLPSVSAYYFSPARDVFVASLCAIGTCLIIHRGRSDTEDVLLNFAGYLTFFVAFVPTTPAHALPGGELPPHFTVSLTQNTWAALAVGLLAFGVEVVLVPQRERHRYSRSGRAVLAAGVVGYLLLAGYFVFARDAFITYGHGAAAIGLFVCVVGLVGINAMALSRYRAECGMGRRRRWANWYTAGFVLMMLTLVVVLGPVRALVPQWIFVLEAALILQFMAFWAVQTIERWNAPSLGADALVPG